MSQLSYQQWDAIADSYIPLLALLCAVHLSYFFLKGTACFKHGILAYSKQTALRILAIILSIIWVYTLMFLDENLKIWPSITIGEQVLDYSTHTALALVFNCYLFCSALSSQPLLSFIITLSMVLYLLLMKYQNYHTFADMFTTTMIVLPPMYLIMKKSTRPFVIHTPLTNTL